MKIAIGCDPNAAALKETIKKLAESLGHQVTDYGSDDPIYANVAIALAADVAAGKHDRGILICGTGIGMSIAANKVKGAYAALITDIYQAQRASLSNNANIITLGAFVTGVELAKALVKEYLSLSFDPGSSSAPKVNRITKYDKEGV
ncbi:ribose-5-phosphate isomerase [Spirochaetia bacterium]|nr:ribose-5-phosphate isomerase [Spirochaetia bacterium]